MNIWLGKNKGYLTDWITQIWVRFTGRRIDLNSEPWLSGLLGDTKIIGEEFYREIASSDNMEIVINEKDSGLLRDLDILRNDSPIEFNRKVKDFYEHTMNYGFDVWSEWNGIFKPFGRLLALIFSRRLQQLNVPLDPMDTSRGVTSEVIQLKDRNTGEINYRIWMRKRSPQNDVIYAGCYGWTKPPNSELNCIKVVFPLPNGNCIVIMKPTVMQDGSLFLESNAKKFGDPGFYFTLKTADGRYYARLVKTMRETIHVFEDENNVLRTDHNLSIWKRKFLKLHYKIYIK